MSGANDYEKLPRSRAEAVASGVKHFFTGKQCKFGHVAPRRTSDDHCTECSAIRSATRREYMKEYQAVRAATPEHKAYHLAYRNNPKRIEYNREYRRMQRLDQEYLDKENEYAGRRRETDEYKEYRREYERRRRRDDPAFRIKQSISRAINKYLRHGKEGKSTFEILGFTKEDLIAHLEKQFTDGMSWDNYGDWHIDHEIPLAAHNFETTDDIDFKRAWSLTNLRPLWAMDNMKKGAKLLSPFQPSLALAAPHHANDNNLKSARGASKQRS